MARRACLFILTVLLLISGSCKKYPDGPYFNLKSKCKRLMGGGWKFELLEIGGIDSTSFIYMKVDSIFVFERFEFSDTDEGNGCNGECHAEYTKSPTAPSADLYCSYAWEERKKYLSITCGDADNYFGYKIKRVGPFWTKESVLFRINKLTNEALWLETKF